MAGQPLGHVAVNGWFLGQLGAGSGQYLHHMLGALPRLAPDVRWSVLIPPHLPALNLPGVEWVRVPLPPLPRRDDGAGEGPGGAGPVAQPPTA